MTEEKKRDFETSKISEKETDSFALTEEFQQLQSKIDLLRTEIAEEKSKVEQETKKDTERFNGTECSGNPVKLSADYPLDMPYYEIFDVNPVHYSEVSIESLDFSFRLKKRVRPYHSLEQLLKQNDSTLGEINGFGKACFEELHAFLANLSSLPVPAHQIKSSVINELAPYREQIVSGDFRFMDQVHFRQPVREYINKVREAHVLLDSELIRNLAERRPGAVELAEMLHGQVSHVENRKKVKELIKNIPQARLDTSASWIIRCFTGKERVLQHLQSCAASEEQTLQDYFFANEEKIGKEDPWFLRLAEWCQYDLQGEIESFFTDLIKNDRELQVIRERANGKTLEEIGKMQSVTRERIRQIKLKVQSRFDLWQKNRRISYKLFMEMNEQTALSSEDVVNLVGKRSREVVYLLKNCSGNDVTYESRLDLFVMNGRVLMVDIREYVETLPDTFPERKLPFFLKIAAEEYHYPEKLVRAVMNDTYKKTKETYHRFRFTLSSIYSDILKKYYAQGIHIHSSEELNRFRAHVKEDYDYDLSQKSDHSIQEIISNIGVISSRGVYKLREEECIAEDS